MIKLALFFKSLIAASVLLSSVTSAHLISVHMYSSSILLTLFASAQVIFLSKLISLEKIKNNPWSEEV
jgi:hypothetical protein